MKHWVIAGLGFLAGSVGVKALTSDTAKRGYVHAMARGMKCKAEYEGMIERAKAEYDDMVAEASYIVASEAEPKASDDPKETKDPKEPKKSK